MNRIITALIAITMMTFTLPAFATIINIPDDYPTIQQGIDASTDGDTVLVQPGTYVENINFNGHNIVLGSLFLTTGDTTYIAETIIDGDSSGSVVTFESGEDSTAVIAGFTITNGQAVLGGGIYIVNSNPTIEHNSISANRVDGYDDPTGGGIYCLYSDPIISNNHIGENYSNWAGGAITCIESSPLISGNIISNNEARVAASGIICYSSDPVIENNIITENDVGIAAGSAICCFENSGPVISGNFIFNNDGFLGAIFCVDSSPVISNNTISQNFNSGAITMYLGDCNASLTGNTIIENIGTVSCINSLVLISGNLILNNYYGGIALNNTDALISGNIVYGNSQSHNGGGLRCYESSPSVKNTIIRGNNPPQIYIDDASPEISYSNIEGGWEGDGNIDTDPLFRDPGNGDFHLMSTACGDPYDSPCIDTGSPAIIDSLLDCDWGLGTILSDMGAYGGGDSATVDIDDFIERLPLRFALLQNYPNPFNPSTTIRYSLPKQSDVRIEIYNILGQIVATLLEGNKQAGYHTITWHADDYPSGVYFARLEAGNYIENIKMVILK